MDHHPDHHHEHEDTFNKFNPLVYDKETYDCFPHYDEMLEAVINSIPETKENPLILEFGCGTGNLSLKLLQRYPKANLYCLDIADNMLEAAKKKLEKYPQVIFIKDINEIKVNNFDAIISSLTLHHVGDNDKKIEVYNKFYGLLKEKGVVYIAETVKCINNEYLEGLYRKRNEDFMVMNKVDEDVQNKWKKSRDHHKDRFSTLEEHRDLFLKGGFVNYNVVWKDYSNVVFGGNK